MHHDKKILVSSTCKFDGSQVFTWFDDISEQVVEESWKLLISEIDQWWPRRICVGGSDQKYDPQIGHNVQDFVLLEFVHQVASGILRSHEIVTISKLLSGLFLTRQKNLERLSWFI